MFGKKKQPAIQSLVAPSTRIVGSVLFEGGVRIDGEVEGDLRASPGQPSMLVISESARVRGEVRADHVIVNGRVEGPIFATELLELQAKARVLGDVSYHALEMHQGASLCGQLRPMQQSLEDKPPLKLAANNR